MSDERRRNRGGHAVQDEVITADEMRDETRPAVEERPGGTRPIAPPRERRGGGGGGWLAPLLALAAALVIGLILWSFFADDDEIPDTGASIDAITDNPARYYGDVVTVGGEVEEIIGQRAFTIGGDDFIGGDELLVVSASGLPAVANRAGAPTLAQDDLVLVTGPVRQFILRDIERDLGVDLDDNLFRDWESKPAVVARSIAPSPRSAGFARGGVGATIDDITDEPERWYGRRVTVSGEVNDTLGARAFTLGGEGWFGDELLVVGARPLPTAARAGDRPLSDEDIVQVTGPVRRFVLRDVEREIGFDLDDNLFADWEGRPVVVARNINLTPFSAPPTNSEAAPLAVGSLVNNPDAFLGRPVMLQPARVTRIVGPNAFVLNDRLLVTGKNVPGGLEVGDRVRVGGPFNRFNLQNVERELGMDLDDQRFAEFRDRPAIMANNIAMAEGMQGQGGQPITDLNTLLNEPNKASFINRPVRLTGLKVQAMPAPNVFWVGPSPDRLLFVTRGAQTQGAAPNVTVGDTITIEGLVLRVPAMDQARQLWNLDPNNIGQLQNQQIYVQAHQIREDGQ